MSFWNTIENVILVHNPLEYIIVPFMAEIYFLSLLVIDLIDGETVKVNVKV